jgi:sortase A
MVMRLFRHSIRFIVAAIAVMLMAGPATANSVPEGWEPGPSRQPSNHRAQSAAWLLGTLRIPAIDVDEQVRVGVDLSVLNQGVGFWAGTSPPGGDGNVVLAGHRSTWTHPFEDLDDLDPGDLIYMTDAQGIDVMYRVANTMIVEPRDVWITWDHPSPTMTLFACHPKGSARYRIVVIAELVSSQPIL